MTFTDISENRAVTHLAALSLRLQESQSAADTARLIRENLAMAYEPGAGDASGHGMAAAVVIAIIQSILHAYPGTINGPAELLAYANHQLCRKNLEGFVTAFLAFYDPGTRRLAYTSAGHPPALIKAAEDGKVRRLIQAGGYPLGIEDDQRFLQADLHLSQGDAILLYTDGITEARGNDQQFFDIERLEAAFGEGESEPTAKIQRLRNIIGDYQSSTTPSDDQTMVVIEMI